MVENAKTYEFIEAEKKIKTEKDLQLFLEGKVMQNLLDFIEQLQSSIKSSSAEDTQLNDVHELQRLFNLLQTY